MNRWAAFVATFIVCGVLLTGAYYLNRTTQPRAPVATGSGTTPAPEDGSRETKNYIDRLKSFDPAAYAKEAIRARDYRHVVTIGESEYEHTPGIRCVADRDDARYVGFVHGRHSESERLDKAVIVAARKFNTALTSDAGYPDKDVCFTVRKNLGTPEAGHVAGELERRPAIVDLHTAVRAQDLVAVARYIAAGNDVNAADKWGRTPLMWAAQRKNIAIATKLLDAGAKLHFDDALRKGVLQIATQTGDADFLRQLLSEVSHRGLAPSHDSFALSAAVELRRTDLIELLLEHGQAPPHDDAEGWIWPPRTAVWYDCSACMETLLTKGKPAGPAMFAAQDLIAEELDRPKPRALLPLLRAALDGLAYSAAVKQALVIALEKNDLRLVRKFLKEGRDVNLLRTQELAELRSATSLNDERRLDAVLEIAKARRRELDTAIRANDQQRIRKIVTAGATLEQDFVFTPLMQAAATSSGATIRTLLDLGSNREAQVGPLYRVFTTPVDEAYIDTRTTALYYALKHVNLDAARTLLLHGADLDAQDGAWPLLTSVGRLWENASPLQQGRLVDLILRQERRQVHADQMLASAAAWGRRNLIDILVARGARACGKIDYSSQAVESVASFGDISLLKRLISLCPSWTPTSPVAQAALKEALSPLALIGEPNESKHLEVIRFLLEQRIPLPKPQYGETTLDIAVQARNMKLIDLFLGHGADINEVSENRTALDWARAGDNETIEYLRARGARSAEELGVKTKYPFPF